jgi:hypothetical protein
VIYKRHGPHFIATVREARHQIRRPFIFMRRSRSSMSSFIVGQRGLTIAPGLFGVGFIQGRELQAYRQSYAAWSYWVVVSRSSRRS